MRTPEIIAPESVEDAVLAVENDRIRQGRSRTETM
jgi:hypothetical protein